MTMPHEHDNYVPEIEDIKVIKRTGIEVPFDGDKIKNAIGKACRSVDYPIDKDELDGIVSAVKFMITRTCDGNKVTVEHIQDLVEEQLMYNKLFDVAKSYTLYRQKRAEQRAATQRLMEQYDELLFTDSKHVDLKRDNANINTDAPMGIMLKIGAEGAKCYADYYALPEEYAKADKESWIHIHDKDFSFITLNCLVQDLSKTFRGGFSTGHGYLREPNSIRSYAALACIAINLCGLW